MLDRILAAIDQSQEGVRALRLAIELAHEIGADLKVIIVQKPLPRLLLVRSVCHLRQRLEARTAAEVHAS